LGIPVRLHVSFVLLAIFVMFVCTRPPVHNMAALGALCLLVWFVCVVLHEAGHCIAAARMGGGTDRVVLTPVGGVSQYGYLPEPHREIAVAMAGPFASFGGWLAAACLLYAWREPGLVALLNPVNPEPVFADGPALVVALRLAVWLNWALVVVNLLPALPLDAGWALRSLLWPHLGHQRAHIIVGRVSLVTGIALLAVAWWGGAPESAFPVPFWLPPVVLATCVLAYTLGAHDAYDEEGAEEDLFGYDFSQGYTSLERRDESPPPRQPSAIRRWLEQRRAKRDAERVRIEKEEEQQVDLILSRLHQSGIDSLTPRERKLLDRVSARYRSRSGE
jgi:Zn-dependent protease